MDKKRRDMLAAMGFLAPNFLGFLVFVAFPIVFSLVLVVTNWSLKPAVETRFVGLDNIWTLIGFRPVAGDEASGGWGVFAAFIGGYILMLAGVGVSLIGYGGKWKGVRAGGGVFGLTALALILMAILGVTSIGWGLVGFVLIFAALFFLTDDDEEFLGKGITGPLLLIVSFLMVNYLRGPFFVEWEANDPFFWKYFYNTLYLMVGIPIQLGGSLCLALILSSPLIESSATKRRLLMVVFFFIGLLGLIPLCLTGHPDMGVLWAAFWGIATIGMAWGVIGFRTLFFLPSFTAGVAIMILWKQMYNPTFGPLNVGLEYVFALPGVASFMEAMGWKAEAPLWLTDTDWAKPALIMMTCWVVIGGTNMLLYLAGLANIPGELYEAADIDGANKWQTFKNVTWPQLAPTTLFIVIMTTIAGLQGGFEQARVMTEGGPAGTTKTLAYYVYEKGFQELELGYASGISWVLFVIIIALTLLNWKFGNQYVND